MPNTNRIRRTTPEVEQAARTLRREMTPAEQVLWQALRGRKLANAKFRRQHAVGRCILDFCCPEHMLAIEVDGASHFGKMTRTLNGPRYWNHTVTGYCVF